MDANGAATERTFPSDLFAFNETLYPRFPNFHQIQDHAHVVFGPIPLVQTDQIFAGEIHAFIAEPGHIISYCFAGFDLATNTSDGFVGIGRSTTKAFVLFPKISHADTAIHPAWGDK